MRTVLTAVLILWAFPASARVNLVSANGTVFGIEDTSGGQLGAPAAFEQWPKLCIQACAGDGCDAPCLGADIYDAGGVPAFAGQGGRQLTLASRPLHGLQVHRKIFVASAGAANADGFIRYYDSLTNPTANPITVTVRIGSASGAERLRIGTARVWRTSTDDADLDATDRWVVTDDNAAVGGSAALATLVHGSGARVRPAIFSTAFPDANRPETLAWQYRDVRIGSQETVSFLTLVVHELSREDAINEVSSLLGMRPVDALFGLSDAERLSVVNFDVEAGNGAPVADAGGPYNGDEGSRIEFNAGRSLDPDGGELNYAWDLDGDGVFNEGGNSSTAALTFEDDGVFMVRVRVTDQSGKEDIDTARVVVRNVIPRIESIDNSFSPLDEGSTFRVGVNVVDPGADTLTFDFDWDGDGAYDDSYTEADIDSASHQYFVDRTYTARLRVTDDEGDWATQDFEVEVRNVAPEIFQVIANTPIREGSDLTISVIARDPGRDPFVYEYDLDGDGAYVFDQGGADRAGADLNQVTTRYPDDGLVTVHIRLRDAQGAVSTEQLVVSVNNANPVINAIVVSHSLPVPEGTPFYEGELLTIDINAVDPGVDDVLRYSFDLDNDGDFQDDVDNSPDPFTEHRFADDGVFVIGARARDDDNGLALSTVQVEIENLPPVAALFGPDFADEGEQVELFVEATDPGNDTLSYDWDLDADGNYDLIAVPAARQQIVFENQGDFTVSVRVNDGDGGETVVTHTLRVRNVVPTLALDVPESANEGAVVVIRANANDPGNDALVYAYDFDNDGNFEIEETADAFVRWTYPDDGIFTIRVVVDDGANLIDGTARIRIENVAPTVLLSSNSPVNEGEDIVLAAEVTDPGVDDTITLWWDLDGDGEFEIEGPLLSEDDLRRVSLAVDDDRFAITVKAVDDDGGEGQASTNIIVANLPPRFVPIDVLREAREGLQYNLPLPVADPGVRDVLTCALIDPPAGVSIVPEVCLVDWVPTYDQVLASPIELRARVSDGDGGTDDVTLQIPVFAQDDDSDGLPDSYERLVGLDPTNPDDASEDSDGDGRDNLAEWRDDTDPFEYEGPIPPELLAPADLSRVFSITPQFEVDQVESPLGEAVEVVIALYADAERQQDVFESDPIPGAEAGSVLWTPPLGVLLEDQTYWWRAKAVSGGVDTAWSPMWSFRINADNQPPSSPVLKAPSDGAVLSEATVQLESLLAVDPDGDTMRYIFQLYRRPSSGAADGSDDEPTESGNGDVRAQFASASFESLIENQVYSWDVVAVDESGAQSERSTRWTFTLNTSNEAPTAPRITAPADGANVDTARPTCVAEGSRDDDSETIFYHFRVRAQDGEVYLEESEPVLTVDGVASWTPESALGEDAWFNLEVFASDGEAESAASSVSFFVSETDDAPTIPTPISPADGATIALDQASLIWSKSVDPESADVRYQVTICDSAGACQTSLPIKPEGWGGELWDAQAGEIYTWQVEAFDTIVTESGSHELVNGSGKSAMSTFTIEGGGGGGGGGGCSTAPSNPGHAPWGLAFAGLVLIGVLRRRA